MDITLSQSFKRPELIAIEVHRNVVPAGSF